MQTALPEDINLALAVIGADEVVADAKCPAQLHPAGFLGQEGIWPRLDDEAVYPFRQDHPAQSLPGLDQRASERDPGSTRSFLEGIGSRQPSDAAPDDDDVWRVMRIEA
jgi:hypothetical protein